MPKYLLGCSPTEIARSTDILSESNRKIRDPSVPSANYNNLFQNI